ncbi:MAG: DUF5615 family PIN-like protein [Candidatus Vogelbacteria bacterium]
MRLLLDANLSPETAIFLRSRGFEAKSLIEMGLGALMDEKVFELARRNNSVLVTFDLDFGEMYYFATAKKLNVIVLRLNDQRVESVNGILEQFFEIHGDLFENKSKRLVIVGDSGIRVSE